MSCYLWMAQLVQDTDSYCDKDNLFGIGRRERMYLKVLQTKGATAKKVGSKLTPSKRTRSPSVGSSGDELSTKPADKKVKGMDTKPKGGALGAGLGVKAEASPKKGKAAGLPCILHLGEALGVKSKGVKMGCEFKDCRFLHDFGNLEAKNGAKKCWSLASKLRRSES